MKLIPVALSAVLLLSPAFAVSCKSAYACVNAASSISKMSGYKEFLAYHVESISKLNKKTQSMRDYQASLESLNLLFSMFRSGSIGMIGAYTPHGNLVGLTKTNMQIYYTLMRIALENPMPGVDAYVNNDFRDEYAPEVKEAFAAPENAEAVKMYNDRKLLIKALTEHFSKYAEI